MSGLTTWNSKPIGLEGVAKKDGNHAKIGVTTSGHPYAIFGDMNQQGTLDGPNCKSSQNGRGGLFYVVDNADLAKSVADLISSAGECRQECRHGKPEACST